MSTVNERDRWLNAPGVLTMKFFSPFVIFHDGTQLSEIQECSRGY